MHVTIFLIHSLALARKHKKKLSLKGNDTSALGGSLTSKNSAYDKRLENLRLHSSVALFFENFIKQLEVSITDKKLHRICEFLLLIGIFSFFFLV